MAAKRISRAALMDRCTEPGAVNLITGNRKSGKTFTAVSMLQPVIEGKVEGLPETVLLTNIVFARAGSPGRNMPPGVVYVDSVEGMFRGMLDVYRKKGLDARMVLVMDEAQTHMMADRNHDPVNQAMLQTLSLIRKFNLSVFFLSPTERNLAPRIRNFIDDPAVPGNMNYRWYKDLPRLRAFVRNGGLGYAPEQFTTWSPSASVPPAILFVPSTTWTTKLPDLKRGYAYDDEAAATFRYGDSGGFDHKALIDACSGVRKDEIAEALAGYFEALGDGAASTPEDIAHSEQIERMRRMRSLNPPLKWSDIGIVEGISGNAARMRFNRASESARLSDAEGGKGGE